MLNRDKAGAKNTLYYDKLREMDEEDNTAKCLGLCKRKQGNKVEGEQDEDDKEKKSHELAVSYKDMEKLLEDFNTAQSILKRQLKDRERREARLRAEQEGLDYEEEQPPEDQIIEELGSLLEFVKSNKECVDVVLEDDEVIAQMEESVDLKMMSPRAGDDGEPKSLINRLQRGVSILIDK